MAREVPTIIRGKDIKGVKKKKHQSKVFNNESIGNKNFQHGVSVHYMSLHLIFLFVNFVFLQGYCKRAGCCGDCRYQSYATLFRSLRQNHNIASRYYTVDIPAFLDSTMDSMIQQLLWWRIECL